MDSNAANSAIRFATLARAEIAGTGGEYPGRRAKLVRVWQAQEVQRLHQTVSEEAQTKLMEVDYRREWALAVFQGLRPSSGYGVEICRIVLEQGELLVYVQYQAPGPDRYVLTVMTSPYHLVRLPKAGMSEGLKLRLRPSQPGGARR